MSKVLGLALGILAAIGGFVDIGDLVFNTAAGATFGYQLAWVIPVGVLGIIVYSEMCGRVAAASGKAVFDAIRERVGFKAALGALISSEVVNLMTLACEIGGVAIALQLLSGLPYRWLILLAVVGLIVIIWVTSFQWIERLFGYGGLCMLVFAVAACRHRQAQSVSPVRFRGEATDAVGDVSVVPGGTLGAPAGLTGLEGSGEGEWSR